MTPKFEKRTFIPYCRVSTKRQGKSGLGLEAQKEAVRQFVKSCSGRIGKEFVEVESGKRDDRPELQRAIAHTRRIGGILTVAKLDRLSRNAAFLLTLQEGRVEFVACDMPEANELTVGIMSVIAQSERKAISCRTREALRAAKARGTLLGSARPDHWKGREDRRQYGGRKGRIASAKLRSRRAQQLDAYRDDIAPLTLKMQAEGKSLRQIAAALNEEGYKTVRGCAFRPMTVSTILNRARRIKGESTEKD
jgi:DNA invertase Pin-like site-specific DNA recombinase